MKNFIFSVKKYTFRSFYMEIEDLFFTKKRKHVVSFMNRQSSCGYAAHFLLQYIFTFSYTRQTNCMTRMISRDSHIRYHSAYYIVYHRFLPKTYTKLSRLKVFVFAVVVFNVFFRISSCVSELGLPGTINRCLEAFITQFFFAFCFSILNRAQ
jgi:hypothetical protein